MSVGFADVFAVIGRKLGSVQYSRLLKKLGTDPKVTLQLHIEAEHTFAEHGIILCFSYVTYVFYSAYLVLDLERGVGSYSGDLPNDVSLSDNSGDVLKKMGERFLTDRKRRFVPPPENFTDEQYIDFLKSRNDP